MSSDNLSSSQTPDHHRRPPDVAGWAEARQLDGLNGPMARLEELLEQGQDLLHGGGPWPDRQYPGRAGSGCQSSVLKQSNDKLQELFEMANGMGRGVTDNTGNSGPSAVRNGGGGVPRRLRPTAGGKGVKANPVRGLGKVAVGAADDRESVSLDELWDRIRRELEEYRNNNGPARWNVPSRASWREKAKATLHPRRPTTLHQPKRACTAGRVVRVRDPWVGGTNWRGAAVPRGSEVTRRNAERGAVPPRCGSGTSAWQRLYALASVYQEKRRAIERRVNARRAVGHYQTPVNRRYTFLRMKSTSPADSRGGSAISASGSFNRQVSPPVRRLTPRRRGWSAPAQPVTRKKYAPLVPGPTWSPAYWAAKPLPTRDTDGVGRRQVSPAVSGCGKCNSGPACSVGGGRKVGARLRNDGRKVRRRGTGLSPPYSLSDFPGGSRPIATRVLTCGKTGLPDHVVRNRLCRQTPRPLSL